MTARLAPADELLVQRLDTDERLHDPDFYSCAACALILRIEGRA